MLLANFNSVTGIKFIKALFPVVDLVNRIVEMYTNVSLHY